MQLECEVKKIEVKNDVDGNPYIQLVFNTGDPMATTLVKYKFSRKTVKIKVLSGEETD